MQLSCKRYLLFRQLFLLVNQVLVCGKLPCPPTYFDPNWRRICYIVLLTLRVYALYECSMRILACMVGSGVTLIILPCVRCFLLSLPARTYPPPHQWALFDQVSVPAKTTASGCHVGPQTITYVYFLMQVYESPSPRNCSFGAYKYSAIRKLCCHFIKIRIPIDCGF